MYDDLCISGGKLTARAFKSATAYASKQIDKMKAENLAKKNAGSQKEEPVRGQQTLADLTAGNDKLTNTIIANTKGEGEKSSEDFWVKAERLLYCALIGYRIQIISLYADIKNTN